MVVPDSTHQSVADLIQDREAHFAMLKEQLVAAQNRMKLYADQKWSDREFQVGDQVLLTLQPYAQSSLVNRPFPKLAFKFFGPYKILQRIGATAYKLDLPATSQIHSVFHSSQLRPFTPDFSPVYSELPEITDLSSVDVSPEQILDRRLVKKGSSAVPLMLIK